MTETQAKTTSAAGPGDPTAPAAGTGDGNAPVPLGRAAVGRAAVGPADSPSVRYTRAPGMPAPPDALTAPIGTPVIPAPATGSARPGGVAEAVRAARATVSAAAARGPRRARLHLKRIDPWSVMKFSFAVSLVLFIVTVVATSVLYLALDAMGVFDSTNSALKDLLGAAGKGSTFKITAKGVIGTAAILGVVNMVLFTALATLGAFIYNVCADLVGGIELTLAEKD